MIIWNRFNIINVGMIIWLDKQQKKILNQSLFKLTKYAIYVFEYNQQIAGYIHAQFYNTLNLDPYVEVLELCVDEQFRGLNIEKKLLEQVEQWAKLNHKKGVRLGSNSIRTKVHQFDLHLGYQNYKDHKILKKDF